MATIERATISDLESLEVMGERFFIHSDYSKTCEYDRDSVALMIIHAIDNGAVFVARVEGVIVGALIAMLVPLWFNRDHIAASEMAWWVDEEHRGGMAGIGLYMAFMDWAEESKANSMIISDLVSGGEGTLGNMPERLGYSMVERSHMRKI